MRFLLLQTKGKVNVRTPPAVAVGPRHALLTEGGGRVPAGWRPGFRSSSSKLVVPGGGQWGYFSSCSGSFSFSLRRIQISFAVQEANRTAPASEEQESRQTPSFSSCCERRAVRLLLVTWGRL